MCSGHFAFDVYLALDRRGNGLDKKGIEPACVLVFPCLDGTLLDWCDFHKRRTSAPPELHHIAWSMLSGIAHVHTHGITHMDIKLDNVLLGVGFCEDFEE